MILLIDGPSGSGKTTLATSLGARLKLPTIHMDDFYPGWSGLAAGSTMVATGILRAENPGYHRWDWGRDRAGEWVPTPAGDKIIEGVGAVTGDTVRAASISDQKVAAIILTGATTIRHQRALRRDPDYAPYWDMWAMQERTHFATQPTNLDAIIPVLRLNTTRLDITHVLGQVYEFIA